MSDLEGKIEYRTIIGESDPGGYQPVRFSRIKYKNNDLAFIDVRMFQRGYDDEMEEVYYPTKKGFQIKEKDFKKVVNNWTIIPDAYVHPEVFEKCYNLIANRKFDSAVLQAFKALEICIRDKADFDQDLVGVKLVRKAFNPESGPLTDFDLPYAEREALSHFVAGAYGLFRNPVSHREVEMDFFSAFEKIVVASTIMKIVENAPVANISS